MAARAAAVHRAGLTRTLEVTRKSSAGDLVSQIDRESERAIVDALVAARPEDAILGEEGTNREGTTGVRWIVDPLDGTANYVTGYPAFGVSIGVEIDGEPAIGVVYDSARSLLYEAVRGKGATRNGEAISVSAKDDLAAALIATGFGYDPALRAVQARVMGGIASRVADFRRSGSAAVDLCAVACGEVDAYYEANLAPWDVAGGQVIAEEAGARVRFVPTSSSGTLVVAANPLLIDPLVAMLEEADRAVGG